MHVDVRQVVGIDEDRVGQRTEIGMRMSLLTAATQARPRVERTPSVLQSVIKATETEKLPLCG